jgi:uncharacterized DUF497 family protein
MYIEAIYGSLDDEPLCMGLGERPREPSQARVRFEPAALVFEDRWILSRKDLSHDDAEERYNALGEIATGVVVFVVYAVREEDDEEIIRPISARSASAQEKRCYEEARRRAEAGYRHSRRQDRRYD